MSIHPKACSIDNWRTLGPTGFKLGIEVGHDQDTLIHTDIEVVRSKVKVTLMFNTKVCPILSDW